MSEENNFQKKPIIVDTPEIFPELTKRILDLDDYISKKSSIQKLGEYAITLKSQKNKSIYKKLLSKDPKSNISLQVMKEIRNKYLKKLVESNSFYFPKELGLDEYKKPINKKEEKRNNLLEYLEKNAKKDKKKRNKSDAHSRKNSSMNLDESRKESLLEKKRKRTDSIEIEEKKGKKGKNQWDNDENEEEDNNMEENNGGDLYGEDEDYVHPDDEDSQNYNYSYDEGGNDDGDDYY